MTEKVKKDVPTINNSTVRVVILRTGVNLVSMVNYDIKREFAALILPFKLSVDFEEINDVKVNYVPWEPLFYCADSFVRIKAEEVVSINFPQETLYDEYCKIVVRQNAEEYLHNIILLEEEDVVQK